MRFLYEAHVHRDCMTVVHGRRLSQLAPLVVLMEVGGFQLQHAENSLVAKLTANAVQTLWALGAILSNVKVTKVVYCPIGTCQVADALAVTCIPRTDSAIRVALT